MTIQLSLHYRTSWGEEIKIRIGKKTYDMEYLAGDVWQKTLSGRELRRGSEYTYLLVRGGRILRREWRSHLFTAPEKAVTLAVRDYWFDRPADSAFWSSAFSEVIFRREDGRSFRSGKAAALTGNVSFTVRAASVRSGERVALFSSLDGWASPVILDDSRFPYWAGSIEAGRPFEYKFALVDAAGKTVAWENGGNRFFGETPAKGVHVAVNDIAASFPVRPWRGAGVAVPVFSLKTEESFGVGEFNDLKKLVDWAVRTGQNIIQLLPINDTTMTRKWQDSYPYNAVSSFALHPQFLHLPDAGVRNDKAYRALRDELNALPKIDYERVNDEKDRLLRKAFATRGKKDLGSVSYTSFFKENETWLLPYAAFCVLRDSFGTADFQTWGSFASYSPAAVGAFAEEHREEIDFYFWEQFLLDAQLKDAVRYAHLHGVALKGDLPIGVSRTSADAWASPELFNMDSQAGAPPDAFSADGQNWGFPTYNWDAMRADGYAWWKARLRKMNEYFDAYRIDHILGFFRIWEIPIPYKSGLMGHFSPALPYGADELRGQGFQIPCPQGAFEEDVLFIEDPHRKGFWHPRISAQDTPAYQALEPWMKDRFNALYDDFYRRHNQFWKEKAYEKLPALLRSCSMLSCGEDLGMIPATVPETMDDLGILSLEIQRMPKDIHVDFADPARYPYNCVCATGTHDTSPLRAWWEEDRELTEKFYRGMLGGEGDAPYFCEPWIVEKIIRQHLASPAMLCILPLQDWLALDGDVRYSGDPADERINIPANPRHYWRYRMHLSLEKLLQADGLNDRILDLVHKNGRGL